MKTLCVDQILDGSVYDRETEKHVAKHVYRVTKVTNSVRPCIADNLSTEELSYYCDSEDWNVTIK